MSEMGRLAPVSLREVWRHEAHDFTPWLLANADDLGAALGMDLSLKQAEHPVGSYSLDLIGTDQATDDSSSSRTSSRRPTTATWVNC